MSSSSKIQIHNQVADKTGSHRLLLQFVEVELPSLERGKAYDFHSLVWEAKSDSTWVEKAAVTRADFQKGVDRRRWVSEVHALDPDAGHAILRIGEEGLPDAAGAVHVTYSWWEWDIANNREVRMIRVCKDPFEPFEKDTEGG